MSLYGLDGDNGAESGIGSSTEYTWSKNSVHDKHKVNVMVKKDTPESIPRGTRYSYAYLQ